MTLNNCLFEENGKGSATGPDIISVFGSATVKINNSKFLNNVNRHIIACFNGDVEVTESHFEGNTGNIYYSKKNGDGIFKTCIFVGGPAKTGTKSFYLEKNSSLELNNCELGDSTFNDISRVTIVDSASAKRYGSIFGQGSLAMIVAFIALMASVASIVVNVSANKKKAAPITVSDAAEAESEE